MGNGKGKLYLTLAFSLAGTSVVTGRFLSGSLGGFSIAALSLLLLLLFFGPLYVRKTRDTAKRLTAREWRMLAIQALFGIFFFRLFLLIGLRLTSASEAGILTGAAPAITSLLAYLFLRERPSKRAVLGIICTVIGISLLQGIDFRGGTFQVNHLGGNALILCAAASESTFNILSRKQAKAAQAQDAEIHPMVQTVLVSAIALALCVVPALLESPFAAIGALGVAQWLGLVWYGLFVTAISYMFFYAGVRRCGAYTTAAFSGLMPLSAVLLSVLLLGERMAAAQWAGGALVVWGMLLIGARSAQKQEVDMHTL